MSHQQTLYSTILPPALLIVGVGLAGCSPGTLPSEAQPDKGFDLVGVHANRCQLGCMDEDSFPEAPGVFINFYTTPENCFDPEWGTDLDQDGMAEFCEVRLAEGFAPRLIYASDDDVSGEPRYAVRPGGSGTEVYILYMTSMYFDFGSTTWACQTFGFLSYWCDGHLGDSEAILVVVDYDPSSYHWYLKSVELSQHGSFVPYQDWELDFSDEDLGRPDIWAAYSKHALYPSYAECQTGGTLGSDSCSVNTNDFVLRAYPVDNVGSSTYHFMDCVYSYKPGMPSNTQECYWTYSGGLGEFGGWHGANKKAQESYGHILGYFGF